MRHTSVIPVVAPNGSSGQLLEIYCEPVRVTQADRDDTNNGLTAVVSALIKINLRRQGETALAAVEKLLTDDAKRQVDLSARKISNGNFPGSSSIDGNSAELGIALTLLMNAFACKARVVIATGTLEVVAGDERHDVDVGAVNNLSQKIQAVLVLAKAGSWKQKRRLFLIPQGNIEQEPSLLESAAVRQLRDHNIHVVPVATLREAADAMKLSLTQPPAFFTDYRGALIAAILSVVGGLVFAFWPNPPLALHFAPDPALGVATPFIVCHPGGRFPSYQKLPKSGLRPEASVFDTLGWRIATEAAERGDYRLALAFVGEQSGLAWLPLNEQGEIQLALPFGKQRSGMNQLDGRLAESGMLIFMAKASGVFNVADLRRKFSERFHSPYPLLLAGDFIKQYADGSLIYFFDTAQRPSTCGETHELSMLE